MKIDARKLKEVYLPKAKKIANDERFYSVPDADGYSLSDYGRLLYGSKWVPVVYVSGEGIYCEYYNIKFNNNLYAGLIRRDHLIALTFRPGEKIDLLINPNITDEKTRLRVQNLHVVNGKSEIVNYIQSKIDGVLPTYAGAKEEHKIENRQEYSKKINRVIEESYFAAKTRATNQKFKKRNPQYADVTMCGEWLNSMEPFAEWFFANDYYYPQPLEVDKDLLAFGIGKIYSPKTCCRLPAKINLLFRSKPNKYGSRIFPKKKKDGSYVFIFNGFKKKISFYNYLDALKYTRKDKAEQIRKAVKEEREKGYMPEYLLEKMSQWADLTEMGLIKMWEPDMKKLIEEGII